MANDFNANELFANLTEKERTRGHHSPEGRAMRTLARALNGWSANLLDNRDVIILCDQAIEDWLRARLDFSPWSPIDRNSLLARASDERLLEAQHLLPLQRLHELGTGAQSNAGDLSRDETEKNLLFCIELVDRHWSPEE